MQQEVLVEQQGLEHLEQLERQAIAMEAVMLELWSERFHASDQ